MPRTCKLLSLGWTCHLSGSVGIGMCGLPQCESNRLYILALPAPHELSTNLHGEDVMVYISRWVVHGPKHDGAWAADTLRILR